MVAVLGSMLYAMSGRPADAERWADAVDRWQYGAATRPDDPFTQAWAAVLRAGLCRRGAGQMRADADEEVREFAEQKIADPSAATFQGIARVLGGDLAGGDASLQDAVRVGEAADEDECRGIALCERSLLAIARGDWSEAEMLAGRARSAFGRAGLEESYVTPLSSAVHARIAMHRGDAPAARQELVTAQRLRPELTYAIPHLAVQARIELARVHLALADPAGARTLMREIDEVLRRRPGLGTLVGEAGALRARLAKESGSSAPGPSALTAAEIRLLPLLSTHLSAAEIAAELVLSRHTIKSRMKSIYRKLDASTRNQAVTRARKFGLLE